MHLAISEARKHIGATAPNPPVGAVGLDSHGQIISIQAHLKAGTAHAEARVIEDCRSRGVLTKLAMMVVTLEPCNHHGRTPPCAETILQHPQIQRVVYGCPDPNQKVAGGGARRLKDSGLAVEVWPSDGALEKNCRDLIEPFAHWSNTGLPWVTIKTAYDHQGGMIPPPGQKTFTSAQSLVLAHELRKRADAILTGSGTVLADFPHFTVRNVIDHPGKTRWLVVMDRRNRLEPQWILECEGRGFRVRRDFPTPHEALRFLGKQGVLEVLVEAGPSLSRTFLTSGLWNQHVVIRQDKNGADQVEYHRRG
jgi:diaminohydroxyphosphoribosylaminopyrimidine deaminase / 5-amino-6-(5-phosphoribosylamino)uracil reductase